MEIRFDGILYSKLGYENSDAGHIGHSGPQIPRPWFTPCNGVSNML